MVIPRNHRVGPVEFIDADGNLWNPSEEIGVFGRPSWYLIENFCFFHNTFCRFKIRSFDSSPNSSGVLNSYFQNLGQEKTRKIVDKNKTPEKISKKYQNRIMLEKIRTSEKNQTEKD